MILVFLGPPGSGKGTQAKMLAEKLKIPHISLGDILRDEVRANSEIGQRVKALIEAGKLAPNEITNALTKARIAKADCANGFILDGYPRSTVQADALDVMLRELKKTLGKVVYFSVSEDQVVDRLGGRRSCRADGSVFHVKYNPPKVAGKCDLCGQDLYQRQDDQEAAIRTRFSVYASLTEPLIERYRRADKLVTIDAAGEIKVVFGKLLAIAEHGSK